MTTGKPIPVTEFQTCPQRSRGRISKTSERRRKVRRLFNTWPSGIGKTTMAELMLSLIDRRTVVPKTEEKLFKSRTIHLDLGPVDDKADMEAYLSSMVAKEHGARCFSRALHLTTEKEVLKPQLLHIILDNADLMHTASLPKIMSILDRLKDTKYQHSTLVTVLSFSPLSYPGAISTELDLLNSNSVNNWLHSTIGEEWNQNPRFMKLVSEMGGLSRCPCPPNTVHLRPPNSAYMVGHARTAR
jgi:hypothetical protein